MSDNFFEDAQRELQQRAKETAPKAAGAEPKKPFALLPGDPVKGTIYKGFVSHVNIDTVKTPNAANYGEQKLVVHLQVSEGEHKGQTEVINRVIMPVKYRETASKEDWSYWFNEAKKQHPMLMDDDEGRIQADNIRREAGKNYYIKTLELLQKLGVDTNTGDEKRLFELTAATLGNAVAWKVIGASATSARNVWLQDPPKREKSDSDAPRLKQSLPDGKDIPID